MKIFKIILLIIFLIIVIPIIFFLSIVYTEYKTERNRVEKVMQVVDEKMGCTVKVETKTNLGIKDRSNQISITPVALRFKKCREDSLLVKNNINNDNIFIVTDPVLKKYPVIRPYGDQYNIETQPQLEKLKSSDAKLLSIYYYNFILAYQGKEVLLPIKTESGRKEISIKIPELNLSANEEELIQPTWNVFLHP